MAPEQLGVAANVGQIIGIPVAVITVAVAVLGIAARPASATEPEPARLRLARQVKTQEAAVRAALLGSAIPIDVAFNGPAHQISASAAATGLTAPDISAGPAVDRPVAEISAALRLRRMLTELVWRKRIDATPPPPRPTTLARRSRDRCGEGERAPGQPAAHCRLLHRPASSAAGHRR